MPPTVALAFTLTFIGFGLWYLRPPSRSGSSSALWIPVVWIFFVASKFPSQWLAALGLSAGGQVTMEDGSPLDALCFLLLILVGVAILVRRKVRFADLITNNVCLSVFFAYCLLAVLWSDFPLVAFKRWIKVLGHPVMALVILSDPEPLRAIRLVMKRVALLMLPTSILFIKYYPELGRSFDPWTGKGLYSGIHHNKNELGYTCMIFSLFFCWNLLSSRRIEIRKQAHEEAAVSVLFIVMLAWLFSIADSMTALTCLVLGLATLAMLGTRFASRRFLGTQVLVLLAAVVFVESLVGVYPGVVEFLGRDPTLTDRTEVWADLFTIEINPMIGAGFESFWLGWRRDAMWAKWWWQPTQAHNGYIETYVNLGWIGLGLLVGVIIATFRKSRAELFRDSDYGRLRLSFLVAILFYNYTEAAFKGVHLVWTMFHLIAIDYPRATARTTEERSPAPAVRQWRSLSRADAARVTQHKAARFGSWQTAGDGPLHRADATGRRVPRAARATSSPSRTLGKRPRT